MSVHILCPLLDGDDCFFLVNLFEPMKMGLLGVFQVVFGVDRGLSLLVMWGITRLFRWKTRH